MEESELQKASAEKPGPSKLINDQQENDVEPNGMCLCGRIGITLIISLVATFILLSFLSSHPSTVTPDDPQFTTTCNTSEDFQRKLYKLTEKVHNILDKQSLRHFLCYDALWGALENRGVLPWVTEVELCMEKEHLAKKSIKFWIKDFTDENLSIRYCWKEGVYVFTDPSFEGGAVKLILFKEEPQTRNLMRTGWKYFRWGADCRDETLQCFHPYLIDNPPLRKRLFGDLKLPVPHFNEAIQKKHYPGTWQLGSKGSMPKNC